MARGKLILSVLVVTTLLTGCSGRRLSDLLSRNDYAPLDQIESREGEISPTGQQADIALAADGEAEPSRRIRFPRLWRRKDSANELQDPFEAEASMVAQSSPTIEPAEQKEKRQKYLDSLRELEARTEALAMEQESARKAFAAAAAGETKSNVQTVSASSSDELKSESFSDFMNATTESAKVAAKDAAASAFEGVKQTSEAIANTNPFTDTAFEPPEFEQVAPTTESGASDNDFAAFVAASQNSDQRATRTESQDAPFGGKTQIAPKPERDRFESELFPDLEAALAEVEPSAKAARPTDNVWNEPTSEPAAPQNDFSAMLAQETQPQAPTPTEDSFDNIFAAEPKAADESFAAANEAFGSPQEEQPVVVASNDSTGFNWSNIPTTEFKDVTPSNDLTLELPPVEPTPPPVQPDPFRQVSSSQPVFPAPDAVASSGLVIPSDDGGNLFTDSFAEALPVEATETVPTVAAATAPTAEAGGISGRTWLFILGCLVVLLLLFLPERQNRANG